MAGESSVRRRDCVVITVQKSTLFLNIVNACSTAEGRSQRVLYSSICGLVLLSPRSGINRLFQSSCWIGWSLNHDAILAVKLVRSRKRNFACSILQHYFLWHFIETLLSRGISTECLFLNLDLYRAAFATIALYLV